MTTTKDYNPEQIDQLLVDAATQGLTPDEQAALDTLLRNDPSLHAEADAYAIAATLTELALTKPDAGEALPDALRARLLADAKAHQPAPAPLQMPRQQTHGAPGAQKFSWTDGRAFGWYAAAAAMIALCVLLLQPTPKPPAPIADNNKPAAPDKPPLAQQFAELVKQPGTVTANWQYAGGEAAKRFENTTGTVVWNSKTQTGFMKLKGLPVNNPKEEQYQLWIVDASRTPKVQAAKEGTDRVDGGVFNVTKQGEVIIPINAKIVARQPAAFAITVEAPGGVVESAGPLQAVAPVKAES